MSPESIHANDESEIRRTIEARNNAIHDKNPRAVLPVFAKDSVGFFLEPPLQQSPLEQDLAGWFSTWNGPIDAETDELHVTIGGDVAFSHGLVHLTGTRTDGEDTDVWFRETLCFKKIDGRWLITHAHESVPMYMDGSLKAAIDLRP